jgi:CDP-4-dehydro-6-deoxyglucose reductase, E3
MNSRPLFTATLSNGKRFQAPTDNSLLDAALACGLVLEHSCRSGRCGSCRAHLRSGTVLPIRPDLSLSATERHSGWILTCASAAASDLSLDVEDLGLPADIAVRTLPCRIASLHRPAPDVMKVELRLPPNTDFRYLPGQYIDMIGKGGLRRSYSLANMREDGGNLELHIRQVAGGTFSAYWFEQARPGDLLRLEGPRGTFILRDVAGLDLVFLATGTGIAPIKAMLAQLSRGNGFPPPRSVHLLWGGRRETDLYLRPEPTPCDFRYTPVLSRPDDGWAGARGHVQDVLLQSSPTLQSTVVYACGSSAMIDGARAAMTAAGLPARHFFADAFVSSSN